jgi:hypothetical protein
VNTLDELPVETVEKQKSFSTVPTALLLPDFENKICTKSVNDVPGLKRKRCPACTVRAYAIQTTRLDVVATATSVSLGFVMTLGGGATR